MPLSSTVASGFIPSCGSGLVGRVAVVHGSNFARVAQRLWMALDDTNWVPDFNPENFGRPLISHPTLQQKISELKQLPSWRSDLQSSPAERPFRQINAQKHFTQILGEARILAQDLYSMWGDTDALSLLRLAGSKRVIDAYDKGDSFALSSCAIAYTLIEADHAVRARLGGVVADEMQMVDVLSKVEFFNYNDPVQAASDGNSIQKGTFPTSMVYDDVNGPVLHVQINHPKLQPTTLLTDVLRLYENKRAFASFGIEDIAVLLNQPLSGQHVASYFTLIDGPFHHVCNSIDAIPEPVFSSIEWSDCKHAFEQCCRYFGEEFMLQTTFGQHPSTTHNTLFKDRLMKILPVLHRFLQGDETSWS